MYEYPPEVYAYRDKVASMNNTELKNEMIRVSRSDSRQWYHVTYLREEADRRGMMSTFSKYIERKNNPRPSPTPDRFEM